MTDAGIASRRRGAGLALIPLALPLLVAMTLALFPWGALRGTVEQRLSARIGRPVTIATIQRTDLFSWTPTVAVRGIRIAGGRDDLARIREARIRFPAWPMLMGRFRPSAIDIVGMRLAFVRDAAGNENWHARADDAPGGRPTFRHLTVRDSILSYRDEKQNRDFAAQLVVGPAGLRLAGSGAIHGEPVRVTMSGAPIEWVARGTAWPFRLDVSGTAVGFTLAGRMDRPLDLGHFTASATGRARDMQMLDAILELGLPASQPVWLSWHVRHDTPDWRATSLMGTIGRSDIAGEIATVKRAGRTRVDGRIFSNRFDVRDLANDEGHRRARLKEARIGPRLIPDTEIDLDGFKRTDLRVDARVNTLLWPGSSPFRSMVGRFTIDHSRLDVAPLTLGLTNGTMIGRISVDQRRGGPILQIAMAIEHARLIDFFPFAATDGALCGRITLAGPGRTIREGIGRSSGTVTLLARDGVIPARTASLLGQDLGRGITAGSDDRATLRCLIARLAVTRGVARPDPVLIDTSRALTRATGSIDLADERLDLALSGAPKKQSLLRMTNGIAVGGTIEALDIHIPHKARTAGGLLKMLGRGITGDNAPIATDLDCLAGAARALR